MEIKVDVSNVSLTSVIGEHYRQTGEDEWNTEPQTLGDAVAAYIATALQKGEEFKTLYKRILELRDEEIREQVKPIVAAAIAAPVQRTDGYGAPIGEPVPLADLIVKEANTTLAKRDSYDRGSSTFVVKIIRDEVERVFKNELSATITAEKAKVKAIVQAKAAELIAATITEGFGR